MPSFIFHNRATQKGGRADVNENGPGNRNRLESKADDTIDEAGMLLLSAVNSFLGKQIAGCNNCKDILKHLSSHVNFVQ